MANLPLAVIAGLQLCALTSEKVTAFADLLARALPSSVVFALGDAPAEPGSVCKTLKFTSAPLNPQSVNLERLQRMTSQSAQTGVHVHLLGPSEPLAAWVAKKGKPPELVDCEKYFKTELHIDLPCHLGAGDSFIALGITTFPAAEPLQSETFYSETSAIEVFVGSAQEDFDVAKTAMHELTHADFFLRTGSIEESSHLVVGESKLNRACKDAEVDVEHYWPATPALLPSP